MHPQIADIVRGARRPQAVRLSLHQRAPAASRSSTSSARQVPQLQRPHGRPARGARPGGLPRGRLRRGGARDPRGADARIPGHHQQHALRGRVDPQRMRALLRRDDGARRRGDDDLAGVLVREGARTRSISCAASGRTACSRSMLEDADKAMALQPVAALPAVPHGQARLRVHALGQPDLQPLRLAASLLPPAGRLREDVPRADGGDRLVELRHARAATRRCQDCMVHCGFEPSAVRAAFDSPRAMGATVLAMATGRL